MRKKVPNDKKKQDISISLDKELFSILDEYLTENDISNRSKYIENLIRKDFEKKGRNIKREF